MINFIHKGKAAAAAPNVHVASELAAAATTTTKSLAFTGFDHTTTAAASAGGLTRQCTEWKWNPMFYYNTLLPPFPPSLLIRPFSSNRTHSMESREVRIIILNGRTNANPAAGFRYGGAHTRWWVRVHRHS